jgi:hypothetical protein
VSSPIGYVQEKDLQGTFFALSQDKVKIQILFNMINQLMIKFEFGLKIKMVGELEESKMTTDDY